MDIEGKTTTRKGRVVYNHKNHMFTQRDAARVTRQALNFPAYIPATGMQQYADFNWRIFMTWAFRYNFLPMHRMFATYQEEDPGFVMGKEIGGYVAALLGVPDQVVELGAAIGEYILNSRWQYNTRMSIYFSTILWEIARGVGTIYQEDIYGRKELGR
jgi:hypothetical protein